MILKFHLTLDVEDALIASFNLNKDSLYICGSGDAFGDWDLNKAVEMKARTNLYDRSFLSTSCSSLSSTSSCDTTIYDLGTNNTNVNIHTFEAEVEVCEPMSLGDSLDTMVNYKYFIGQKCLDKSKSRMFLKQVEYTWRKLNLNAASADNLLPTIDINDKWGYHLNDDQTGAAYTQIRIDAGWLLENENETQFHFYESPLQLWSCNLSNKPVDLKIIPFKTNKGMTELKDYAYLGVVCGFLF
jgi:hypothetical protein